MIVRNAPAKVNLWLKICGKRPDGFHELDTLFAPIGLADIVSLEKKEAGISLRVDGGGADVPGGSENLAWRAAEQFFLQSGLDGGVSIHVTKRIPSGAGLGGGSSDAAAVLLGLEELYENPLAPGMLQTIAVGLGSDVPFFLGEGAARGRGRGEVLEKSACPWSGPVLLCKPPFGVSTPWAYGKFARMREQGLIDVDSSEPELWRNDLERPVFKKFVLLALLKDWLMEQHGVVAAMMCGSGSTMLAALDSPDVAGVLEKKIAAQFGKTFWSIATSI
jgi:4-diphosphocytidyl-2-C-methyl-D-erythritol kinase